MPDADYYNAHHIEECPKTAGSGEKTDITSNISGRGTVVIQQAERLRREARRAKATIRHTEHNGMVYHVVTVKLFTQ